MYSGTEEYSNTKQLIQGNIAKKQYACAYCMKPSGRDCKERVRHVFIDILNGYYHYCNYCWANEAIVKAYEQARKEE